MEDTMTPEEQALAQSMIDRGLRFENDDSKTWKQLSTKWENLARRLELCCWWLMGLVVLAFLAGLLTGRSL